MHVQLVVLLSEVIPCILELPSDLELCSSEQDYPDIVDQLLALLSTLVLHYSHFTCNQ